MQRLLSIKNCLSFSPPITFLSYQPFTSNLVNLEPSIRICNRCFVTLPNNLAIGAEHWITEVIGLLIWNLRSLKFDKFCLLQTNSCHVAGKKGLVIYFLILMYQKLFDYFFWIFKKMNFNPRETLKVRKWKN